MHELKQAAHEVAGGPRGARIRAEMARLGGAGASPPTWQPGSCFRSARQQVMFYIVPWSSFECLIRNDSKCKNDISICRRSGGSAQRLGDLTSHALPMSARCHKIINSG
jgi:hypothetical protein